MLIVDNNLLTDIYLMTLSWNLPNENLVAN